MAPENGSNESGIAKVTQTEKGLVVDLQMNTAPSAPQPAHIHRGTCAELDPAPAYRLKSVTKGTDQQGTPKGVSDTTLSGVTLAQLTGGSYAINVHESASEAKTYVSCGDV
jgi:hypothetical protein